MPQLSDAVLKILQSSLSKHGEIPEDLLNLYISDINQWDSLFWVNIILQLENHFDIMLDLSIFSNVYRVDEFVSAVSCQVASE